MSLRSGAQVQDALRAARPRGGRRSTSGASSSRSCSRPSPTRRSSRCTAATARTGPCRGCWRRSGSPTPARGRRPACAAPTRLLAKHLMREAGIPTPDFHALRESAIKELGAAAALPSVERRLGFPLVVKPASQGSALGVKFARDARGAAGRDGGGVLLRPHGRCSSATSTAATWRCRCSTPRRPASAPLALPVVEAVPREEDFYDYESRYEIGMTTFVCPAELAAETTERAQELALRGVRAARLPRLRARRPDARAGQRRAVGARDQRRARADRDEPAAAGRRRRGDRLRRAGRADPRRLTAPTSARRGRRMPC